jgi:hypothetical protein
MEKGENKINKGNTERGMEELGKMKLGPTSQGKEILVFKNKKLYLYKIFCHF